jgi:RNA polymerase II subunit A C-terminal domain phosphatase
MICAFLDENGRLFSHRILSRDECLNATSKKDNLKALFPDDCGDAMVCIIDDREDVWNHATNLIQVKPYHFFQHTGDINAPPGLAKKELDGKGVDFNKMKLQKIKKKVEKAGGSSKKGGKSEDSGEGAEDSSGKPEESKGESKDSNEDSKDPSKSAEDSSKSAEDPSPAPEDPSDSTDKIETDETEDGSKTPPLPEDTKDEELKEDNDDNLVEIQDPDDYLLYLESILKLIHEEFYKIHDKTKEIPDLKQLVPKLKAKVLVGVSIVFSGLVPNIVKLERSRPYLIAKNLGAQVTEAITETTTHLVAASTGTQKVFQAQKNKKIKIVTPGWLWTCAERWEHVDELLYPLSTSKTHKMRQIPAHCSPDRIPEPDDVKFNNPYLQMSDGDIADMEAEVEDTTSESESDEAPPEAERPSRKRKRSGEKEKPVTVDISGNGEEENSSDSGKSGRSSLDEDEESPSAKFRRGNKLPALKSFKIY